MSRPSGRILVLGLLALAGAIAGTLACDDSAGPDTRTLRGAEIAVGAGRARTEIVVDASDRIRTLSVVFTRESLDNLPPALPNTEFILPLSADAPRTVFDHVAINWAPQGHPPPMVYTHPHFDVHFYLISMQQRDAISPADPDFGLKAVRAPDAAALPAGYVGDQFAIPRMGTHWTDRASHEFHGSLFTSSMIIGFYDARMIFIEPMMTRAFLESRPDESKTIALPAQVPAAGDWPTTWRVRFDNAGEYRVELTDFVSRG
ncbi:MAG: DUF5602 domain-containing protein [Gemmatimonadetes bacterium]|nr:DUF5602 domain-containing protein [Gemmatimonadota bacterium]